MLDPADWASAFAPLAHAGSFATAGFLMHALAWLTLLLVADRLMPGRPVALAAGTMAVVLAGRILFANLSLEAQELAGMAAALALSRPLARFPRTERGAVPRGGSLPARRLAGAHALSTSSWPRTALPSCLSASR